MKTRLELEREFDAKCTQCGTPLLPPFKDRIDCHYCIAKDNGKINDEPYDSDGQGTPFDYVPGEFE